VNSENRPALSGIPWEGVATTSCIAAEFTKCLIAWVKFRRLSVQALNFDRIKVASKNIFAVA
jgi:hypothetical protein